MSTRKTSLPRKGRPLRKEQNHHLVFKKSTYQRWQAAKKTLGFAGVDNSAFADELIQRVIANIKNQYERHRDGAPKAKKFRRQLWSTPAHSVDPLQELNLSPICNGNNSKSHDSWVDVTGISSKETRTENIGIDVTGVTGIDNSQLSTSVLESMQVVNPFYGCLQGNPFEQESDNSDCSSGSDEDCNESEEMLDDERSTQGQSSDEGEEDHRSEDEELSLHEGSMLVKEDNEYWAVEEPEVDNSVTLSAIMDDSMEGAIEEEHFVAPHVDIAENVQMGEPESAPPTPCGPKTLDEHYEDIKKNLEENLKELKSVPKENEHFKELYNKPRVIVEVEKIEQLLCGRCNVEGCSLIRTVTKQEMKSGLLIIHYSCPSGHLGVWHSSEKLGQRHGQDVYTITTLLANAVFLTGNNFDKTEMIFKMLNCAFISQATSDRIQTLFGIPAIKELWSKMKEVIVDIYKDEKMVLCGDGRMDSPGFSAKYCVYSIMEQHLGSIVDMEIVDKREAQGSSTLMEKIGLKRLLLRLMSKLLIGELATDASATIMKLVRDLKAIHHDKLQELFHSLDVWHKSCKLTSKLTNASKVKGNEAIAEWIQPIRNHFWYCAQIARGNPEEIKDAWIGVVHHICGEHEWADGVCRHGPLTNEEQGKTYLGKASKAFKAVQEIVFDRQWLASLKYYVHFRHTSNLESFNSMMLKYAPKRNAFSYESFTGRAELAAIDHNFHLFRKIIPGKGKRTFSKRSKNWRIQVVKEPKSYDYWPALCCNIMKRRLEENGSVRRRVEIAPNNPTNIAPNIAMRPAPATKDLMEAKLSRFSN